MKSSFTLDFVCSVNLLIDSKLVVCECVCVCAWCVHVCVCMCERGIKKVYIEKRKTEMVVSI